MPENVLPVEESLSWYDDEIQESNRENKKENQVLAVLKRMSKRKASMIGFYILILYILVAILAPVLAPYGYNQVDMTSAFASPSLKHLCGTDKLGRDIFSRLLYGAKYSLGLGFVSQIFGLVVGITLGCVAGYFGGRVDNTIMRILDIIQSIPGILLSIILSSALGGGWFNTCLALGISHITGPARMIRAQFLGQREQEYVEAAQAINCSKARQMFVHILPNCLAMEIVATTMGIGGTVTAAAGLSYIGLGIQPPIPEWGAMLTAGKEYIRYYPYMIFFPGLVIAILVLACNLMGDGLRDALDPKLKN